MADLLLRNCSNFPSRPIYPYAFTQLSALGRKYDVSVATFDFLGMPFDEWAAKIDALLALHRPRMIGLHVRQGDDMELRNYVTKGKSFLPFRDAQSLVGLLRARTQLPIAMGGVGLTIHARDAFERLRPDYAMLGCADSFFERFDALAGARDLDRVPNLMFWEHGMPRTNARMLYAPLDRPEYTEDEIDRVRAFYADHEVTGWDAGVAAVEVSRGCPYRCYFCAEPTGKGNRVRYRDLDVVFEDVRTLYARGYRSLWCICSELNTEGPAFAMQLAERFAAFNEQHEDDPVEWSAYALPRFDRAQMAALQRARFAWHFNEAQSLDDENLKAARVPYRTRHVLRTVEIARELDYGSAGEQLSLFLGNAFARPTTIRTTLARLEEAGLTRSFRTTSMASGVRIYPFALPILGQDDADMRFAPDGEDDGSLLWPTFRLAPGLREHLRTADDFDVFLTYVQQNFFSRAYVRGQDWVGFLSRVTTPRALFELVCRAREAIPEHGFDLDHLGADTRRELDALLGAESEEAFAGAIARWSSLERANACAFALAEALCEAFDGDLVAIAGEANLPIRARHDDAYPVLDALDRYASFSDVDDIVRHACDASGVREDNPGIFALRCALFRENVATGLRYRSVLLLGARAA